MIPDRVNIAGIIYDVKMEDSERLREALKSLGVKGWERRYAYWDPHDTCIYIANDLPRELQEFYFCLEVLKAWSFYVGDKLFENERILRPYAAQLRLLLHCFPGARNKRKEKGHNHYIQ